MQLVDIAHYLGRYHPLVVHLPIGFLLLAALADLAAYARPFRHLRKMIPFVLMLGFASAVLACVLGWMLAGAGDYDATLLNNHKLSGIALAVFAGCLVLLTRPAIRSRLNVGRRVFSFLSVLMLVILSYSGHQGGSLTHGSDFLSIESFFKEKRPKPASVDEAFVFEDLIQPILDKKCAQCHNSSKLKGDLSVTSLEKLLKGGKNGAAVTAGKLDQSELYHRITLDPSHEDFMPTDGKTPLTADETAIIEWWIASAMAVDKKQITELNANDTVRSAIAAYLQIGGARPAVGDGAPVNPNIPLSADPVAMENLRTKGFMVRVMLHEPVMLDVTLPPNTGKKAIEAATEELKTVAPNIVWLNLSENRLSDGDLSFLPLMLNVEKMRLEKNDITDNIGSLIGGLKYLQAINLNQTQVTPEGVAHLKEISPVQRVYSWQAGELAEN